MSAQQKSVPSPFFQLVTFLYLIVSIGATSWVTYLVYGLAGSILIGGWWGFFSWFVLVLLGRKHQELEELKRVLDTQQKMIELLTETSSEA